MKLCQHFYPIFMQSELDKQRFLGAWSSCASSTDIAYAERLFTEIEVQYQQPHRFYHNAQHVRRCLDLYDLAKAANGEFASVELALWLCDLIHEPSSRINEFSSAHWFREKSQGHFDERMVEKIANLVLITAHKVLPKTQEEKLITDIDLACFAGEWADFKHASLDIRKEYSYQSDHQFMTERVFYLQSLLDRQSIYSTRFFFGLYEQQARRNIQKQIERLQSQLS